MAAAAAASSAAQPEKRRVSMAKTRKFITDGVFYAELNDFFQAELAEEGYAGVEIRSTSTRTEIVIRANRTAGVLGDKGRRIREMTAVITKRFKLPENSVDIYAEKLMNR